MTPLPFSDLRLPWALYPRGGESEGFQTNVEPAEEMRMTKERAD
jgi:hypothetical protein